MRIPFRKKSRYQRARAAARRIVERVRQRWEDRATTDEPQHGPRVYRTRPVLRIIIKD